MKTCDACKHWRQSKTYGPVRPDGEHLFPEGRRNLISVSVLGSCMKFVSPIAYGTPQGHLLDRLFCDATQHENQWGSGAVNAPQTGPKFGCIHWEAK